MLVLTPVIVTTLGELSHTRQTIVTMTRHMERLLPMLLTLLTALGGSASSAFLHPMVAAASGSMVFLAREVILRLVMCTCAVTAVNHLSDRAHLTRMAQLLRGAVCWLLGVSFTVFLGAMSLQGVTSASIDGVAIRAAKYAVDNFVPVVGGMFSDTMDTLVGCTLIVKNALGVAAVLVLVGALVGPLLRTLAVVFMLRLSAALLEPIADGDIVCAIGDFSRTVVLFFITMLCVGTMYFLLIVQMTGGGADDDPDGAAVYALRADGDDSNGAGRKRCEREHADDRRVADAASDAERRARLMGGAVAGGECGGHSGVHDEIGERQKKK